MSLRSDIAALQKKLAARLERQWRIVLLPADTPQAEIDALLADGRTQILLGVDANKVLGITDTEHPQ